MSATSKTELLERKIELLELEQKKKDLEAAIKAPSAKPWWTSAVELLALPAAILAIVFQMTQTTGSITDQEKTEAETAKIRIEEVKTRAELAGILDELAEKKGKGVETYRQEVEQTLPKLQETIDRLNIIEQKANRATIETILIKYVLLWILFHAIGLFFDIVSQVWSTMLASTAMVVFNRRPKEGESENAYKRRRRVQNIAQWLVALLSPVPSILRWSMQLSIFIVLMIPLFNEASFALGSSVTFDSIIGTAPSMELSETLGKIKTILFGSGN